MERQRYYEDVVVGEELLPLVKYPTTMQLVKFASSSSDYYQIHYDKDYAVRQGLPGVIVHGWLGLSFLAAMVSEWIGEQGRILKLDGGYKGINPVHEELFCYARVARKYEDGGEGRLRLDLWVENPTGKKTITGYAMVELPRKSAA